MTGLSDQDDANDLRTLSEGPQVVTVRGRPTLVVVSQAEYAAMRRRRRKPLAELFRESPIAQTRLDLRRSKDTGRKIDL